MERADHIQAIRQMLDYLEANPDVPVPFYNHTSFFISEKEAVAVANSTGPWNKEYSHANLALTRSFQGASLTYYVPRDAVCSPKRTEVQEVEELDNVAFTLAVKELRKNHTRMVEKEIVVEWDCKPLLAPREGSLSD